jgi:uncharacterized membrane protein
MKERINSVDLLRGIVMVVMALDHVRDYFTHPAMDPTNLATTTPWLFFTRWITHFCAPTFVFLAGTGAYLQLARGKSKKELSWFLFTRGIWLMVLEMTLVRFGWTFDFNYSVIVFQVIWALGGSMIVLALLVHLPLRLTGVFGIVMIITHNFSDTVKVDWSHPFGFLWAILHTGDVLSPQKGLMILPFYPLIPWIGVMAAGYVFGYFYTHERTWRENRMMILGIGMCILFIVLRSWNVYGDAAAWAPQQDIAHSLISFFNVTKYPPSLLFLLMTLGPAIIILSRAERWTMWIDRVMITFGRVPMFYYLLHIPLIHALSMVLELNRSGNASFLTGMVFFNTFPDDYGYSLWIVYLVWALVIIVLYPLCRWYENVKMSSRNKILSYL